jgi:5-formyltetrahydrofolate cyclo-ligase
MEDSTPDNSSPTEKAALRSSIKLALAAMRPEERHEASISACQRLMGLDEFRRAGAVMLYMPMTTEVDLSSIALRCIQSGKTVCVPKVVGTDLRPVEITRFDVADMDVDHHGVRTPRDGQPVPVNLLDLVVVPGLAFDSGGRRLGRGGGIYDRFLVRLRRSTITIGIAYDTQIVETVPAAPHDINVHLVVTERRVIQVTPTARARGSSQ